MCTNLTHSTTINGSINATLNPAPSNLTGDWLTSIILVLFILIILAFFHNKRTKLENLFSAPISVISTLFFVLIAGIVYWSVFTPKYYGDFIYLITFIVVSMYTYYTLQIVKLAYKGPALLHVQERHSEVLKNFLDNWSKSIISNPVYIENRMANYVDTGDFYFANFYNYFKKIESNWEYRDLLDFHLPDSYKTLEENWTNFMGSVEYLGTSANILYDSIRDEINQELAKLLQKYPLIELDKTEELMQLHNVLYLRCIGKDEYDIKLNVGYSKAIKSKYHLEFSAYPYNGLLLVGPNKEDMESAKAQIERITLGGYMEGKHADVIEELIRYKTEMEIKRKEFNDQIRELAKWPLLPGTSCDRIKDFKIK